MSNTVRIATVTATGRRYIVQKLDIAKAGQVGKVHTWGEVVWVKGLSVKCDGSKTFLSTAVTVTEVARTQQLLVELFNQSVEVVRAKGNVVTASRNGRTYTNHGTQEQLQARAERVSSFYAKTGIPALTAVTGRGYTQPSVTDGGTKALPETREEIRAKIIDQLTAPGANPAIRQNYSNGEFISSSLIVGTTFAAVADRSLDLEVAGNVAHYDADLGVWWRTGGSWD